MKITLTASAVAILLALGASVSACADELVPGSTLQSLLQYAKDSNPEFASMRHEAQAASERVVPAGALADPKFRAELMDITKAGEQSPTLLPGEVGSTRYSFMQDLPWFGKLKLRQDIAQHEADASQAKAEGVWIELAAKIKVAQAQRYYLHGSEKLNREIFDLLEKLEQISRSRYASGLTPQQDVIRAQIEQTNMRNELVALEGERAQVDARLNTLLSRPARAPLALPESSQTIPAPQQLELSKLEERARQRNPLVFAEQARIQSAEKTRDLTYKNRYPDFTLSITPVQYQSAIKEWSLMVELNLPLQQLSRRAMERESESMLAAAQARKQALANQVLSEIAENLTGLEAAQRTRALVVSSLLPQAELTFNSALAGYENNKVDFATLLDAQRQIRQAKQSQIKAQLDVQMRLAEIEKLIGEDL
ncbi:MAG: TolC family protein [Burkholderiaceae bacterium]|jgi:outer membrane protein TolC|nr:TolC family protein [Burkholderiaceae bacterium]